MNNPLGTDKQVMSEIIIEIRESWCKGCEFCVSICPHDVLRLDDVTAVVEHLDKCTGCELCVWICPDFAIRIEQKKPDKKKPLPDDSD